MNVSVDVAGPELAPVLRNLGELYAYDFSELLGMELSDVGRFDHDFWRECWGGGRVPYLFRVDGRLAGFAIVARGSRLREDPAVHDMAEFFVVRRHRRQRVGASAAARLFAEHPGPWEIRERASNPAARSFWHVAIGAVAPAGFVEELVDDASWRGWVQRFEVGGAALAR